MDPETITGLVILFVTVISFIAGYNIGHQNGIREAQDVVTNVVASYGGKGQGKHG